jgi:hypothetical protein
MKKSTKAALFSTLIFPGAGLLWLKQYTRAAIFMIPALAISYYILHKAMDIAQTLAQKVKAGSIPPDLSRLLVEVHTMTQQLLVDLDDAMWLFILCWTLSILSSYFAGKKLEAEHA